MRFWSLPLSRCAATLLSVTVLMAGCSRESPVERSARQPLPVSVLLSVLAPSTTTAATAEYARESEVRWSDTDLRARPLGVRHRVDFFPDTSFELVFDTRLNTSRDAVSYAGIALNDPGSMAVLTQFKGLIKLTVDSPTRGHYSVHPQPYGRYIAREYTGEGAKHEPDDFGDPESHLAYTNQVLAQYTPSAIAATCGEAITSAELNALTTKKTLIQADIAALLVATTAPAISVPSNPYRPPDNVKAPECIATPTRTCDIRPGVVRPPSLDAPIKPTAPAVALPSTVGRPPDTVKPTDCVPTPTRKCDVKPGDVRPSLPEKPIKPAAPVVAAPNASGLPSGTVKPTDCVPTPMRKCDVRPGVVLPPLPEAPIKPKGNPPDRTSSAAAPDGGHWTKGGLVDLSARGIWGIVAVANVERTLLVERLASKRAELRKIDSKIAELNTAGPVPSACRAQLLKARANHERVQRWLQREIAKSSPARAPALSEPARGIVPTLSGKMGDALAALDVATLTQVAQLATDAPQPSPAGQSIRRAALPDMHVDSVDIDSSCSDSSGAIKLAVVVSQKVMAKAGRTPEEVKILNIEIIHGLDITNASLRGSNISTPGIDVGFSLANVQAEPLVMGISHDVNSKHSVNSVFGAYWPPDETDESRAFYTDVEKVAPNADVVLVLIDGDASFAAPRGIAFGTKNISGDRATNRRLAVVKHKASVAEYFYTFAHELGHTLGAGHDEADPKYQSFARGAVVKSGKQRWASLMALSQCPDGESTPSEKNTCRRVPYYSSAGLSYPGYSATLLGDADKDNASAMRLIRDNVTRLRCSQPREASVWLQKGAAPDPLLRAQAWEAESIWIRPELDPRWRYPYAHLPAAAGADAFVNVMLHNATQNSANSQLQVWRAKPAKGLLLSPRWDDMERVDQAQCATPANGRVTLAQAATTIVQVPCASGQATALEFGRDSWAVRWDDGANAPAGLINDTIPQQPLTAWRSMRNVTLALEQPTAHTVLVRKRAASESRQVNIRIEPATNQYNFSVRDSGLTEVRYARTLCRNPSKPECVALAGRTDAVASFDGATMTIELSLPPDEEVPIRLFFKRTPNVPQQNVLLRVFEEEVKLGSSSSPPETKIVGGTSFIVRHAPGDVTKAK